MTTQIFDLGFIGHKAFNLQTLFNEYTAEPNEYGYFLKFENYSELEMNKGVIVQTNCFEDEDHFKTILMHKLLAKL